MTDNQKKEIEVDDLIGEIDAKINDNLEENLEEKNENDDNKVQSNNTTKKNLNEEKKISKFVQKETENKSEQLNNNPEQIEVQDRGMNTDPLPPEELQRLVDNNQELMESNEEEYSKEIQEEKIRLQKELTEELNKKTEIYELLLKSNNELKNKIELSNKKYNEIMKKIEEKKQDNIEQKITLQIQELEKEINANNMETERYKKLIDQLRNKLDFKINLERSSNFQGILKEEALKNKELKEQLSSLTRLNKVQSQYIKNYDKENQISNKLDILKKEIQQTKECIKDYQTKNTKLDKFIKLIHEKIISIEMLIKKEKAPKEEQKKKLFTKEELKDIIDSINKLKVQIQEKRNQLNNITKQNDSKINKLLAQNKQIEVDYKESEKLNKMLIFKRNELKKSIKNISINGINNSNTNKKRYKLNNNLNDENKKEIKEDNQNFEKELENEVEFNEPEKEIENNQNTTKEGQKLFAKNDKKSNEEINFDKDINNEIENDNLNKEKDDNENEYINDSNLNVNNQDIGNNDEGVNE